MFIFQYNSLNYFIHFLKFMMLQGNHYEEKGATALFILDFLPPSSTRFYFHGTLYWPSSLLPFIIIPSLILLESLLNQNFHWSPLYKGNTLDWLCSFNLELYLPYLNHPLTNLSFLFFPMFPNYRISICVHFRYSEYLVCVHLTGCSS